MLLRFVRERKGGKLAVVGSSNGVWLELEKAWQALRNVKVLQSTLTTLYTRIVLSRWTVTP